MKIYRKWFLLSLVLPFLICSCSAFKWTHESTMEVDLPIEKTWKIFTDINNSNMCMSDSVESIYCTEEIETGATVYVKMKDNNILIPVSITEVEPYKKINSEIKLASCHQQSFIFFEEITPGKTKIITKNVVKSPLLPFVKSRLMKEAENQNSRIKCFLDEAAASEKTDSQCL